MGHALREAHRVLKPGGLLIDLRPAPAHRRVGIVSGGRYRRLGTTRESLDPDHAAGRALRRIRRTGLFRLETVSGSTAGGSWTRPPTSGPGFPSRRSAAPRP